MLCKLFDMILQNSTVVNLEREKYASEVLGETLWYAFSGATPRKEKPLRRSNRTKAGRLIDLCTWIGKKVCMIFIYK